MDGYGAARTASYRLRPGARAFHTADLHASHCWYNLSITCAESPDFRMRLAGHVETGRPSTSDPALGGR